MHDGYVHIRRWGRNGYSHWVMFGYDFHLLILLGFYFCSFRAYRYLLIAALASDVARLFFGHKEYFSKQLKFIIYTHAVGYLVGKWAMQGVYSISKR